MAESRVTLPDVQSHLFLFLVLSFALSAESVMAQKPAAPNVNDQLKKVQEAIEEGKKKRNELDQTAADLRAELLRLRRDKVRVATSIRKTEAQIFGLESQVRRLNKQKIEKVSQMESRRNQFGQVVVALQRLSRLPPEAVFAYPIPPSDLVRTAILLRTTVPQIEARAKQLRENLISLEKTRTQIKSRRQDLIGATKDLEQQRRELDRLDTSKSNARQKTLAARQVEEARLERLTEEAETLKELFDRLEQERIQREHDSGISSKNQSDTGIFRTGPRRLEPKGALAARPPFETDPITSARGKLTLPVIGSATGRYNGLISKGQRRKGLEIQTQPGAQVVSPYNGRIVFSGPFRGYGHLLIIEHGEGYHSLLAGMARIEGSVGQWLLAGEPVGIMARPRSGKPSLYMELRRNGRPINPNPWLATGKGKING